MNKISAGRSSKDELWGKGGGGGGGGAPAAADMTPLYVEMERQRTFFRLQSTDFRVEDSELDFFGLVSGFQCC
jgi:hypothetical protein